MASTETAFLEFGVFEARPRLSERLRKDGKA